MVLYDAANLLTLVETQWSLNTYTATSTNPPNGEVTYNENLNTLSTSGNGVPSTGWTNPSGGGTSEPFTIGYEGYQDAFVNLSTPMAVSGITSFSFQGMVPNNGGTGGVMYGVLVFTDATTAQTAVQNIPADGNFHTFTFGPTSAFITGLPAGKTVATVYIYANNYTYGTVTVEGVSLNGVLVQVGLRLQIDEYDPMHPEYQIVFLNRPERITPIAPNVIKHEQSVGIEFYMKLNNYLPDDIENVWRPLILSVKNELTRIMNTFRFNGLGNGSTINHSSWKDSKFPHGFAMDADPISLSSTMTVEIVWYEALNGDEIGMRVVALDIFGNSLMGLLNLTWVDTDPWVQLQVPKGPMLEQHLLGPHVSGTFDAHDWHSIYALLYNTAIPENPSYKPVNADGSKTAFSTNPSSSEFTIYIQDNEGNTNGFQFVNVRIKTVQLDPATVLAVQPLNWTIKFMADYVYPIPPIL